MAKATYAVYYDTDRYPGENITEEHEFGYVGGYLSESELTYNQAMMLFDKVRECIMHAHHIAIIRQETNIVVRAGGWHDFVFTEYGKNMKVISQNTTN